MTTVPRTGALLAGLLLLLSACAEPQSSQPHRVEGGDPSRGQSLVRQYGCVSCHAVPGVPSVEDDRLAPDLEGFEDRYYIAGQLPNRPEELIRWLQDPPGITPGTVMPDMGVSEQDARDIAAYLYDR